MALAIFAVATMAALAASFVLLTGGAGSLVGATVDAAFHDTHGPLPATADDALRHVSRAHDQLNSGLWGRGADLRDAEYRARTAACASLERAAEAAAQTRTSAERDEIADVLTDCAGRGDARELHDRVDDLELYLRRGQGQSSG